MDSLVNKHQKTKLIEINSYLTCFLCKGYFIDATTISECLHSFCRSCILKFLQENSHCPVCELVINTAKPNLKLDKTLQDIVYKLVPELFLREMHRRREFYARRPAVTSLSSSATATATAAAHANVSPEQRGEDIERTIFNPRDTFSLSIEYTGDDSSGSSCASLAVPKTNEEHAINARNGTKIEENGTMKRYLQCPGMCRVDVLKKFVSGKYNVDESFFYIDILYKRVPLPGHYTLIDIAYIYSWKRNEPMRFFFRITDISLVKDRFDYMDFSLSETPPSILFETNTATANYTPAKSKPIKTPKKRAPKNASSRKDAAVIKSSHDEDIRVELENVIIKEDKELTVDVKSENEKENDDCKVKPVVVSGDKQKLVQILNVVNKIEQGVKVPVSTASSLPEFTLPPKNSVKLIINVPKHITDPKPTKAICVDQNKIVETVKTEPVSKPVQENITQPVKSQPKVEAKEKTEPDKSVVPQSVIEIDREKQNFLKSIELTLKSDSPEKPIPKTPLKQIKPLPIVSPPKVNLKRKHSSPLKLDKTIKRTKTLSFAKKMVPNIKAPSAVRSIAAPPANMSMKEIISGHINDAISKVSQVVEEQTIVKSPTRTTNDTLQSLFGNCNINIPSSLSITLKETSLNGGSHRSTAIKPVINHIEILKLPDSPLFDKPQLISSNESNKPTFESSMNSFEAGKQSFEASKQSFEASKQSFEASKQSFDTGKATIESIKQSFDNTKPIVDITKSTIDITKSTIDISKSTIDITKSTIDITKSSMESKQQSLENTKKQSFEMNQLIDSTKKQPVVDQQPQIVEQIQLPSLPGVELQEKPKEVNSLDDKVPTETKMDFTIEKINLVEPNSVPSKIGVHPNLPGKVAMPSRDQAKTATAKNGSSFQKMFEEAIKKPDFSQKIHAYPVKQYIPTKDVVTTKEQTEVATKEVVVSSVETNPVINSCGTTVPAAAAPKRNILEIASQLHKKSKLEHDPQLTVTTTIVVDKPADNGIVINSSGKVAIPRLSTWKSPTTKPSPVPILPAPKETSSATTSPVRSVNTTNTQSAQSIAGLHSPSLGLNYTISVKQNNSSNIINTTTPAKVPTPKSSPLRSPKTTLAAPLKSPNSGSCYKSPNIQSKPLPNLAHISMAEIVSKHNRIQSNTSPVNLQIVQDVVVKPSAAAPMDLALPNSNSPGYSLFPKVSSSTSVTSQLKLPSPKTSSSSNSSIKVPTLSPFSPSLKPQNLKLPSPKSRRSPSLKQQQASPKLSSSPKPPNNSTLSPKSNHSPLNKPPSSIISSSYQPSPLSPNQQLLEKYNIQNLAQLSANWNMNFGMPSTSPTSAGGGGGGSGSSSASTTSLNQQQLAAFQQAMILKHIEMQNRQSWLNSMSAANPLVQYEKYLQSFHATTTTGNGQKNVLGNLKDN